MCIHPVQLFIQFELKFKLLQDVKMLPPIFEQIKRLNCSTCFILLFSLKLK